MNPSISPFRFLQLVLAILMAIHAIARISLGIVDDFGGFLTLKGFPMGVALAWLLTVFELVGALLLIFNYAVRYVCAYFIIQLLMGIFLVHLPEGWFVVGAGRNGIEYSVLLICCFFAVGWQHVVSRNMNRSGVKPS